jgi:hypothetical protein
MLRVVYVENLQDQEKAMPEDMAFPAGLIY